MQPEDLLQTATPINLLNDKPGLGDKRVKTIGIPVILTGVPGLG